jgi:hypothetical protein
MNLSKNQIKGKGVYQRIISEAWKNEHFKNSLLKNPEQTLEIFFRGKLPFGKKIKVTDQTDNEYLYINIPVIPDGLLLEDAELKKPAEEVSSK